MTRPREGCSRLDTGASRSPRGTTHRGWPARREQPEADVATLLGRLALQTKGTLEVLGEAAACQLIDSDIDISGKVSRRSLEVERRFGFILRRPLFERGSFSS